jgi:hypothetical protein
MSHVTGTVQPVSPAAKKIGPDFGPATNPPDTWTLNFAHVPAPTGTKLLILHFTGASLPANNRLEVDIGYDMDVFTSADGTDFWTRPINIHALAGELVPIRYITDGAATGGVQLDQYGRESDTRESRIHGPLQLRSIPDRPHLLHGTKIRSLVVLQHAAELGEHRLRQTPWRHPQHHRACRGHGHARGF